MKPDRSKYRASLSSRYSWLCLTDLYLGTCARCHLTWRTWSPISGYTFAVNATVFLKYFNDVLKIVLLNPQSSVF